jgi:hypothetical protein
MSTCTKKVRISAASLAKYRRAVGVIASAFDSPFRTANVALVKFHLRAAREQKDDGHSQRSGYIREAFIGNMGILQRSQQARVTIE